VISINGNFKAALLQLFTMGRVGIGDHGSPSQQNFHALWVTPLAS